MAPIPGSTMEYVAGHTVDRIGLQFKSLPPGAVFVKAAVGDMWAEKMGIGIGDEIVALNKELVKETDREYFVEAMKDRPLLVQVRDPPHSVRRRCTFFVFPFLIVSPSYPHPA